MTITIEYSDARCGAGKTEYAIDLMTSTQSHWLYVVDRRDVYQERIERIYRAADRFGTSPTVSPIKSNDNSDDARPLVSVRKLIEDAPFRHGHDRHVIVIITHEAMRTADFGGFGGWSIIIDEAPNIFDHTSIQSPASYHHFAAAYDLVLDGKWNRVVARQGALAMEDVGADEIMRAWLPFHRRVMSKQPVLTKLASWAEMDSWSWWSIWSPMELAPFDRRIILANAFTDTITYKLIRHHWPDITFKPLPIASALTWAHREITIRYFATQHRASASWFESELGREALNAWAKWIAANVDADRHFWATNNAHRSSLAKIHGTNVSIKIAGSNEYRDLTQASVCYTAKASQQERSLFKMFGIEPDEVMRAREYEDIIQVLFRSALRVPNDTRSIIWNVYDQGQAAFLADYLASNGFPVTVISEYIDIGIDHPSTSRTVRSELLSSEQTAEKVERRRLTEIERKREKRAKAKADAEAAGAYVGRGRPRKAVV